MDRDELAAWMRLQLTPGVGNETARKLLAAFGLPDQIFMQSAAALAPVTSPGQRAALLSLPSGWADLVATTWDWLQADPAARRVLPLGHASYPVSLLNMEDPPLLLYAMGAPQAWLPNGLAHNAPRSIAVVGSRNPTAQGALNARQFSQALAQSGLTIVSGLALGVDGAAHEGALESSPGTHLATIAVVGTGLDRVYPRQHRDLAHRIAQRGLLVSEYPLGTPPLSANFPRRNRIIAGLSQATLVVEAALQSGSLITARLASEQGRDVFAIPGSIHATQAKGCHALIKQGAKLVESAQDILEEWPNYALAPPAQSATASQEPLGGAPTPEPYASEDNLLSALGHEPTGLDALLARTGLPTANAQARLMELEISGQIARLPGGLYQRLTKA